MSSGIQPPRKTLADYLAIGVGPVLIMLMVGSLVFFLVEVGYRGSFTAQVQWTLFWFTVGSVLVSRISIEQGSSHGWIYGLALGAATAFRVVGFLGAPLGALLLLGLIWWCGSKLTWDCTFIDESADASGRGLLHEADPGASRDEPGEAPPPAAGSGPRTVAIAPPARPHAPGLWVIYVSLGALPVFGVGQWAIPTADAGARVWGFVLAATFVASAFALLLTTSFLGLRRYLRQRRLVMPAAMARTWMVLGAALLTVVLMAALLLPRPRGLETLAGLGLGVRERSPQASANAWMSGEAAPGEGRRRGSRSAEVPSAARPAEDRGGHGPSGSRRDASVGGGERSGEADDRGASGASVERAGSARSGQGQGQSEEGEEGEEGRGSEGNRSTPTFRGIEPPPFPAPVVSAFRWLSYVLGAVIAGWLVLRYGRQWLESLRRAWPRRKQKPRPAHSARPARSLAFAEFDDPFASGRTARMTPAEITAYTFDALQAWAVDGGRGRRPEQTPGEFAEGLASAVPEVADEVLGAVRLYVRLAYGGVSPDAESLGVLRRLWALIRPALTPRT